MVFFRTVDFTNANLTNVDFSDVNGLTSATLTGATINGDKFVGSSTSTPTFAQLSSTASYTNGDLSSITFNGEYLVNYDFSGINFSKSSIYSCYFSGTKFNGSYFPGVTFAGSTLTGTDFSDADMRGSTNWMPATDPSLGTLATGVHDTILPTGSIVGLSMTAGEKLVVRNNALPVTISTSATMDPTATLEFQLSSGWTSPMNFASGVSPSLPGTLDLEFAAGTSPELLVGDTFQIFGWSTLPTPANQFTAVDLAPNTVWDLSKLYTTGQATLIAAPEPSALAVLSLAATAGLRRRRSKPRR